MQPEHLFRQQSGFSAVGGELPEARRCPYHPHNWPRPAAVYRIVLLALRSPPRVQRDTLPSGDEDSAGCVVVACEGRVGNCRQRGSIDGSHVLS